MSKLLKEFEEDVDYFVQENKNRYCGNLQKNDWDYQNLLRKIHKFIDKLLENKENKIELEDEFFDCFYELMGIESMFLYKQGYKDCFKIIQLLEQE